MCTPKAKVWAPGVIWTLEARLAEAELAEKSFRTTMGKNGKAERGLYPSGRPPYGYRWSGGEDSHLEADEDKAAIVRRIFESVAAGVPCTVVRAELQNERVPTPAGGRSWGSSFVHSVIQARAYIGEHEYGVKRYRKLLSERDRQHFEREIQMLSDETERMRAAAAERRQQGDIGRQVEELAALWPEISAAATDAEKAKLIAALVREITVSLDDIVTVTGALTALACSNRVGNGSQRLSLFEHGARFEIAASLAA